MIQRSPFGRTGHASSVMLFGAAALARASQPPGPAPPAPAAIG